MLNKIRRWFKIRKVIKRYKQLGAMIDSIDRAFTKAKISRQKRRQFWDDFVRSPEARKKFVNDMGRNI